ncbi:hypothetical protein CEXT_362591 [Caerostris extrusa]|uniref:Myotubularin phosphatase domain-containing protein n=1 Tax=Caerostris extrusa TaxID=172846 RepID=A0AAV4W3H8_CAEEX|nr:hypothetical protein CEXT_362591 [Caerostris extrusa]
MTANWLKELNLKPRSNSTVKTFKSYVNLDPEEGEEKSIGDLQVKELPHSEPTLLPGEVVIAQAENVLKFNTLSELNKGILGLLSCTNFKLSFVTAENFPSNLHQKNALLGEHDICLINIDAVYHVNNGFRIFTFSFKFSPLPQRSAELERCKCPGWRVTLANEKFLLCESLPECFVVPSILLDMNLNKSSPHFAGRRVPTWSWGMSSGASIVRMAALDSNISDSKQKDVMVDAISRASPRQLPVQIYNLDEVCPSYKDVQNSFLKLRDLCMPCTVQEFWETDHNYLSKLDSTKWLLYISFCLNTALEAAKCLLENTTVIFSEHEGRDLSVVLSCLVQIMLDPLYRTTSGFELLIQKEWVALGHPFTERHHLVSGSESEESPVFLLFLDCVWQLTEQCPATFEFSETYLTSLWDSCHISLFDTFLFNNHKNRTEAILTSSQNNNFSLRSVWRWSRQFSKNDLRLFCNPLYILNKYTISSPIRKPNKMERPKSFSCLKDTSQSQSRPLIVKKTEITPIVWNEDEENLLKIDPFLKSLKLWHQCYLRWIPLAHILGGGPPVLFLTNHKICNEIQALEKKIKTQTRPAKSSFRHRRVASDDYTISADVIDSCKIQDGSSVITSVFPFAPVAPWDWTMYNLNVPSTSCLKISYTDTETEEALDD